MRVAEVSRNKLRELGSSFAYQGSPGAVASSAAVVQAHSAEYQTVSCKATFASAMNLSSHGRQHSEHDSRDANQRCVAFAWLSQT